jgi:adenylate kinase
MDHIVILVGPPGSGKGSLSESCIREFGWVQLSTGNLCRKHIAEQTEIGKEIELAIKAGVLISDTLITKMVEEWLEANKEVSTVILDGYPRTVPQAAALDLFLNDTMSDVQTTIVRFYVPDEEIVQRLGGRIVCINKKCQAVYSTREPLLQPKKEMICDLCCGPLGRRKDDAPETVRDRLEVYHVHESALIGYYLKKGACVVDLEGNKPVGEVLGDFKGLVGVDKGI